AGTGTLPAVAGFLMLLGGAGLLAWSGEPIAVTEPVAEPPSEPQADEEKPTGENLPMPPDPDPASRRNWVTIPAGTFVMGSPDEEEGRYPDEGPTHPVRVSRFECMRYPVTRRHYADLMGEDPGSPEGEADDRPVNKVSWYEVVDFCNRLSERQGLTPCYRKDGDDTVWVAAADGYRLPTEAEWEYACRAGSESRWSFGDDEERLGEYAWFGENSDGTTQPVGRKPANARGLYDMHGNVDEWCWDAWSDYSAEPQVDPVGPSDGDAKLLRVDSRSSAVVRGGSYWFTSWGVRSAYRFGSGPEDQLRSLGFRCVRGPRRQP
ncbi:MAG: formylglycine-generating enzyme family protein, partial [bacterium]|nr:formylglycine-generating enzyme family protein [bacterium]